MIRPIRIPSAIAAHVDMSTTMPQFRFSAWFRHAHAMARLRMVEGVPSSQFGGIVPAAWQGSPAALGSRDGAHPLAYSGSVAYDSAPRAGGSRGCLVLASEGRYCTPPCWS